MNENSVAIARRLASQCWGEIQHQKKLGEGIWDFETAGHGGIVVDVAVRPELAEFKTEVLFALRNGKLFIRPSEQHFAAFEEDCEAVKVEWTYPSIMGAVAKLFKVEGDIDEWKAKRKAVLENSLKRWNPDWLSQHPFAWGEKNPEEFEVSFLLSRDGEKKGIIKDWNSRPCTMEGCTGHRMRVRWPNGTTTYPCTKGIESTPEPNVWKIC